MQVVDSYVQRYPGAVTWFSPGSFRSRPPLQTSIANIACAGDWVRMGDHEHGSKGLCQERAYVSGLQVMVIIILRRANPSIFATAALAFAAVFVALPHH